MLVKAAYPQEAQLDAIDRAASAFFDVLKTRTIEITNKLGEPQKLEVLYSHDACIRGLDEKALFDEAACTMQSCAG